MLFAALLIVAGAIFLVGIAYGRHASGSTAAVSPAATPTYLAQQVALLQQRQDNLTTLFQLTLVPLAIIVAILGAGGVVGIVLSFRNETRSGQIHDLIYAGTSAQQERTEETHAALLDASQKTLTLVNDTLALARDANDRAAKELSQRAERVLHEITEDATSLFLGAYYNPAFGEKLLKIVVEDPQIRSEIADLAQRLNAIEGPLEFQEIPLTASAYLVKGITHHLNQDEKRATRFFERASEARNELNPKLMLFAYYWMGYSCNNIGQYAKATDVFALAGHHVAQSSPLQLEISRLEYESRFFELSNNYFGQGEESDGPPSQDVQRVLVRLSELRARAVEAGASSIAQGIAITEGNINFWLARSHEGDERQDALDQALALYQQAGRSLWARFGFQEASRVRFPDDPVDHAEYAELETLANSQTEKRAEPRSKTLLYLTSALCMIRQEKPRGELAGTSQLLRNTFSNVDGSLTLYSQFWKTNVDRERFEESDLGEIAAAEQSSLVTAPIDTTDQSPTQK
jgi:hypothetical protein